GESSEPHLQRNTAVRRHGMQTLGKVTTPRRPPANLPSLKAEHSGSDPSVSLVPSGGTGWGTKPGETGPSPNSQPTPQPPSTTTPVTCGENNHRKYNEQRRQNLEFGDVRRRWSEFPRPPVAAIPARISKSIWGGSGPGPPWKWRRRHERRRRTRRPIRARATTPPADGRQLDIRRRHGPERWKWRRRRSSARRGLAQPCDQPTSAAVPSAASSARARLFIQVKLGPFWSGRGPGRPRLEYGRRKFNIRWRTSAVAICGRQHDRALSVSQCHTEFPAKSVRIFDDHAADFGRPVIQFDKFLNLPE
ncbi:unnamed protein product, partial [Nesidiocoris tenuis]